jgi:hypothetical protein
MWVELLLLVGCLLIKHKFTTHAQDICMKDYGLVVIAFSDEEACDTHLNPN